METRFSMAKHEYVVDLSDGTRIEETEMHGLGNASLSGIILTISDVPDSTSMQEEKHLSSQILLSVA